MPREHPVQCLLQIHGVGSQAKATGDRLESFCIAMPGGLFQFWVPLVRVVDYVPHRHEESERTMKTYQKELASYLLHLRALVNPI